MTYLEKLLESKNLQGGTLHQFCICAQGRASGLFWLCPSHDGFIDLDGNLIKSPHTAAPEDVR